MQTSKRFPGVMRRWLADRNVHEAAKILGVWDNTLNGWLEGDHLPYLRDIERLAEKSGLDHEKILRAVRHDRLLRRAARSATHGTIPAEIEEPTSTGVRS